METNSLYSIGNPHPWPAWCSAPPTETAFTPSRAVAATANPLASLSTDLTAIAEEAERRGEENRRKTMRELKPYIEQRDAILRKRSPLGNKTA